MDVIIFSIDKGHDMCVNEDRIASEAITPQFSIGDEFSLVAKTFGKPRHVRVDGHADFHGCPMVQFRVMERSALFSESEIVCMSQAEAAHLYRPKTLNLA